jgi:hypothetical protein
VLWFRPMRPRRVTQILVLLVAGALAASVAGCGGKKQPRSKQSAVTKKDPGAPLKPVVIEPAPTCDVAAAPSSQPRGIIIALYHTANVVGEVEPCG